MRSKKPNRSFTAALVAALVGATATSTVAAEAVPTSSHSSSAAVELPQKGGARTKPTPDAYEEAAAAALARFPELADARVEFILRPMKSAFAAARPKPSSLFKKRRNRRYRVFLNNDPSRLGSSFESLPLEQQIGLLGHELTHVVSYLPKHGVRIAFFVVCYSISRKFRRKVERTTDVESADRGFGPQLLEFALAVESNPALSERFKDRRRRLYLSAGELQKAATAPAR